MNNNQTTQPEYPILKPEGQRTKADEWEACYNQLFNSLNPVMKENAHLQARLRQASELVSALEVLGQDLTYCGNIAFDFADRPEFAFKAITEKTRDGIKQINRVLANYQANKEGE